MINIPFTTRGINNDTIQLLRQRVLYPDETMTYVGKGQIMDIQGVRRGIICATNRTIIFYEPKRNKVYDRNLTEYNTISYKRGLWSSHIEMIKYYGQDYVIIEGVSKGEEERIADFLKKTVEERKRFLDEQRSKGLFCYGFLFKKWGSKEEAKQWLEYYLTWRGFKKINNRWVTAQEHLDHQQRQKGLYKYIEAGVEKWASIDKILNEMSPLRFQEFIGLLFSSMGYEVTELPYVADYGADLLGRIKGETVVVQVKKYSPENKVGAREVRTTLGSLHKYKASRAILITTSGFTKNAHEQARSAPIELWDGKKLKQSLKEHLPSNLVQEQTVPSNLWGKVEKIYYEIVSKAISQMDPQTAMRAQFEFTRGRGLDISIKVRPEGIPVLVKVIEEHIPTIPIEIRIHFQNLLRNIAEEEIKIAKEMYQDLMDI